MVCAQLQPKQHRFQSKNFNENYKNTNVIITLSFDPSFMDSKDKTYPLPSLLFSDPVYFVPRRNLIPCFVKIL